MVNDKDIREHMMVHTKGPGEMNGVRGQHIGTVDHVQDGMIKLTKKDAPDGKHHLIPLEWVESVEGDTVHLSKKFEDVMQGWETQA
jgi:hypothetical protein